MSPTKILPAILLLLVVIINNKVTAQCRAPLPASPCTGIEPLVIADEIINQGTTKWYYGPAVTMNSLTMRGGTLIICGNLTIDKFYMDSGRIIVNPAARFVIGSGIGAGLMLQGNCSITNYGTLECFRNLSLENGWATPATPNVIVNTSGAIFRMPNQYFVINNANSWFVNNGFAQFWGLITDNQASPASVCLGSSTMQMAVLINKRANAYVAPSNNACVYVFQFSQFFGALTNSSTIFACLGNGHSSDAGCIPFGCTPNAWGSAQVFNSCNSCASLNVLSLEFVSFSVDGSGNRNLLKWQLNADASADIFYIERSADGRNFYPVDSIYGNRGSQFDYTDAAAPATSYYRIRCMDFHSGQSVVSKVVSSTRKNYITNIYPSPFTGDFFVEVSDKDMLENIMVSDVTGKSIPIRYERSGHLWRITPLVIVINQVLIVQVSTDHGTETRKIIAR
jgi:hypothetical protein